jgi:lipopolysaccharide export system protein LptA
MVTFAVMAQKKSVVNLIKSERTEGVKINGKDVIKVYKGTFQQDYSVMRSDSAYLYAQDNAFDAFGNVNITQGDTLNIYSDKLNYDGNTKIAILTDNVRMIDKDAVLTTNYLTYNTATRIGTYTGGGKLVNKDNTLTSKNGYYFAFSRDAYFRYNVVLVTPDALIKTDTLRYNSGSRIAYFYGPTNIYDTKDKKDTLYTENGLYNTITEQAFFGKKNLYKQGTKTLKGDSLFYDKLKGYGRAVKRVTFHDREQNITLKGELATYFKEGERTIVTQDPYVVIVTEEKDTTKKDTTIIPPAAPAKKNVKAVKPPVIKKAVPPANTMPVAGTDTSKNLLADTSLTVVKAPAKVKRDSIYISADTLETQILTFKDLKIMQEKQRLAAIRDTTIKVAPKPKTAAEKKAEKEAAKILSVKHPQMTVDSSYLHKDFFGEPRKPVIAAAAKPDNNTKRPPAPDEIAENDPIFFTPPVVLSDTARIRIVKAYHHAKLFKSDLQAKADSMFYSYSDSTLHCFVEPLIWAQGSQISGDTITLQMKNKKMDNMHMFPSAFIVNIEKGDSTHFNQMSGKKMKGYFKSDKLERMYIAGNAESIYFSRDSLKNVDGMQRSLSSRMRIYFKNGDASKIFFTTKPEHRYGPLAKFTEDEKILKGFIWKPKERPVSKESIIPSYGRKNSVAPAQARPSGKTKNSKQAAPVLKQTTVTDSVALNKPPVKMNSDSSKNTPAPVIKTGQDSVPAPAPVKQDSVTIKAVKPKN